MLAPGSRSAPLALALADDGRIRLHVHLDERSAAFFALGAAKASGRPTLVLCTSGTAAAHFHPAVLEADHSRVPLIVCTADRPAELRDTGAPQTTDQVHLYGDAVRFFADLPADGDPAARAAWRPIAARVWAEAAGPPAGPVHLNVAFREPLIRSGRRGGTARPSVMEPGRADGRPWVVSHRARVGGVGGPGRRGTRPRGSWRPSGGWWWRDGGARPTPPRWPPRLRWPLLADAISGRRSPGDGTEPRQPDGLQFVTTYEALLRVPEFARAIGLIS